MIYKSTADEKHLLVDYVHDQKLPRDVAYASLTAPKVVRCEIYVDGDLAELVYAGGGNSHSWWTPAGGKFLPPDAAPNGLKKGQHLEVWVTGPCALRIDWVD